MNERDEQFAVEIGRRIRGRRLAEGMTQEGLAARAELHRTTISAIERGKTRMRGDTCRLIEQGLDASYFDIVGGIEWIPPTSSATGRWRFDPPSDGSSP